MIRALAWRLAVVAALVAAALLLPGCVTTLARGETAVQPCTIDASATDSYARRFLMYHRCDWQQ